MLSENEEKSIRMRKGAVLILGVVFFVVILVSLCVWGVLSLTKKKESQSMPLQSRSTLFVPAAMPANLFGVHLPLLSRSVSITLPGLPESVLVPGVPESVLVPGVPGSAPAPDLPGSVAAPDLSESVSEQIWEVTNVIHLGYELDGQYYDLATFTRADGKDTITAYCINPGWDVPEIGTEYWLNAEGLLVPLNESAAHPLQRFLEIR